MAKNDPHFRLRLPAELKAAIEKSAVANNRSINAEIVSRLETSEQYPPLVDEVLGTVSDQLAEMRDAVKIIKAETEQINMLGSILEFIAGTDGKLDPSFMTMLRGLVATKGQGASWLKDVPFEGSVARQAFNSEEGAGELPAPKRRRKLDLGDK